MYGISCIQCLGRLGKKEEKEMEEHLLLAWLTAAQPGIGKPLPHSFRGFQVAITHLPHTDPARAGDMGIISHCSTLELTEH